MRCNRTAVTAASVALLVALAGTAAVLAVQTRANTDLKKANGETRDALAVARKSQKETAEALARTEKAQKETAEALALSEQSRKQAEAVRAFLVGTFRKPDPKTEGRDVKVADILDQALAELAKGFTGTKATEAAMLDALGESYFNLGFLPKAEEAFRKVLAIREATLGLDHPETLTSRNNLALAYWAAGRTAEAITIHEATVRQCESKLGLDHPYTLQSRNVLGLAYRSAERVSEAIPIFEATLKLRESKLGPDHPDTLISRNNLATAYLDAGRAAEAIPIFEANTRLLDSKLGPDHSYTLGSRNNLANAYRDAGRIAEAIPILEADLRLFESKLGPSHPDTLTSRNNLASAYQAVNRWGDSESVYRETLARRRVREKLDSPLLADDLAYLGRNLLKQSKASESEPLLREGLAIRAKATPDDYRRFDTASLLGGALLVQGKNAEAEPLVIEGYEGIKAREAKIPTYNKATLTEAGERVVQLYRAWGKPDKAADWAARLGLAELPADVFAK
jgi:tetratricopeptide (TPR) repeat protein